jgi:hypothetical protein
MLQQIVTHTPLYVWAILAFLAVRGLAASTDSETTLGRLFIIPAVMLALSMHGTIVTLGASGAVMGMWFAGAALGTMASWKLAGRGGITAHPERGTVALRGSWLPLMMMLSIFCTKYAVAVALAISPALGQQLIFIATVCALYGVFNGIFFGRLARSVSVYRHAATRAGGMGLRPNAI